MNQEKVGGLVITQTHHNDRDPEVVYL